MAFSWFRLEADLVDHPKLAALERDLRQPLALSYVIRSMAWVKRFAPRGTITPDHVPDLERAARWRRGPGELVAALARCGFLDRVDLGGSRGAGWEWHDWWEHQGALVEHAENAAERQRIRRSRAGDTTGVSPATGRTGRTGQDKTNKTNKTYARSGGSLSELQPNLPGVPAPPKPPRQPSKQEELFAMWIALREKRLGEHGIDPVPPDEKHQPAFINATIGRWLSTFGELLPEEVDLAVVALFDDYLKEPWPAKFDPPWPFRALASEKVWRKMPRAAEELRMLEEQRAERAARAPGASHG